MLPKINSAMLILTHACNLACRHCFVHKEPETMTLETAKAAADFLIANSEGNTPEINYFGGEPTLCWDSIIVPLTRYIRDMGKPFHLAMTSNGVLLTDERLQFMKDNDIGLLFSIDGAKATQDYNRPFRDGSGSFDALESRIQAIAKAFPNTTFRMTAIPPTCGNLFENICFAKESGFKNFFVVPNVFEPWDEQSRETITEELRKYGDMYIDAMQKGETPMQFSTLEKAFSDIKQINAAVKGAYRKLCTASGKCGMGASRFASIHPNGNLYACQEMTSNEGPESIFYIGNIFTGVLNERREMLMALYDSRPVVTEQCGKCRYVRICDGGCVANNYMTTGYLNTMPEVYCWWRGTVLEEAIRISRVLGEEQNPEFLKKWRAK